MVDAKKSSISQSSTVPSTNFTLLSLVFLDLAGPRIVTPRSHPSSVSISTRRPTAHFASSCASRAAASDSSASPNLSCVGSVCDMAGSVVVLSLWVFATTGESDRLLSISDAVDRSMLILPVSSSLASNTLTATTSESTSDCVPSEPNRGLSL